MDTGYARVSTTEQDLTVQLEALAAAGCAPIHEEKRSGVAARLPVRDETLRQLRPGDTLTVHRLDRLGRSTVEVLRIVKELDSRGVRFRCVAQPVDTTSAMGNAFMQLLAVFAELERNLILERTAAGKARRAAEGKHPGGRRLYGWEPDHETTREGEAALLREAAERLLAGESSNAVIQDWAERGIVAYHGGRWQQTPLRNILRNPRTVPILGQDTFDQLGRLFEPRGPGRPVLHLLSGILRCPCGQGLSSAYTGKHQRAYRCNSARWSGGRSSGCGRTYVSERAADHWAMEAFIAAVASNDFADALNRRQSELLADDTTAAQLDAWRAELADLENVPARYAPPDAKERHAELSRLVRESTARLMAQPDLQALIDLPRTEHELRAAWSGWSTTTRRQWLHRVLDCIIVHPPTGRGRGSDVAARMDPRWRV